MTFRCKHCERELDRVEVTSSGWRTESLTAWGSVPLDEEASSQDDVCVQWDRHEIDDWESQDTIDADYCDDIQSWTCPLCRGIEADLDDLVEVVEDEVEDEVPTTPDLLPWKVRGAYTADESRYDREFASLDEAKSYVRSMELYPPWLFVVWRGKVAWVSEETWARATDEGWYVTTLPLLYDDDSIGGESPGEAQGKASEDDLDALVAELG